MRLHLPNGPALSTDLDKAHADGAHLGELVDHLEAVVDGLGEQLRKELVVEDLQAAAAGDLANGGGVEAVLEVAVAALHEHAAVAQALGVHLAAHVIQVQAWESHGRGKGYLI